MISSITYQKFTNRSMVGYSSTPLVNKLGLKDGMFTLFVNTPENYIDLLGKLPDVVKGKEQLDFIHYFTRSQEAIREDFPDLKTKLKLTGMLWISWPKSSCSFASSDLTDNVVRNIGLDNGLVDVKIASIDENWSAMKFVYRLKDRK